MKNILYAVSSLALLSGHISEANAASKKDFEDCDGLKRPKKKGNGMRVSANEPLYSFGRPPSGKSIIASCTRALESERLLPTHDLRRAHLLRARAAAYISIGDADAALTDVNNSKIALGELGDDPFFKRSIGVSYALLEGLIAASKGDKEQANIFAKQASDARPYATNVQSVSAMTIHKMRDYGTNSSLPWDGVDRLGLVYGASKLRREAELGNFKNIAKMSEGIEIVWPEETPDGYWLFTNFRGATKWTNSMLANIRISYALATVGKTAEANEYIVEAREKLDAAILEHAVDPKLKEKGDYSELSKKKAKRAEEKDAKRLKLAQESAAGYAEFKTKIFDPLVAAVEARIALNDSDRTPFNEFMKNDIIPISSISLDLLNTAKQGNDDPEISKHQELIIAELNERHKEGLGELAKDSLITLESKGLVDYKKSKTNVLTAVLGGTDLKHGFKSEANENGTTLVKYSGGINSAAMVEEMSLLRAAEITKEAGKQQFIIMDRDIGKRFVAVSVNGVTRNRTFAGYAAELQIRFLEENETSDRALNAEQIIADLGSIYYEQS